MGGIDDDPCLPTRDADAAGDVSGFTSAAFCVPTHLSILADGAAFDPQTGAWREIAPAPVPFIRSASGVVHGGLVYVLAPGQPETFLAYHPTQDRWEHLPSPETRNGILADAGDRLVLFKYQDQEGDPDLLDGLDHEVAPDLWFDPDTKEWSAIPPDPLVPSWDRTMVWTGAELVLLGLEQVEQPCSDGSDTPLFYRAAAFDPEAGTWRLLAGSGGLVVWGGNGTWYLDRRRLINPSLGSSNCGLVNPDDTELPRGGILDLDSGEWSLLPDPPQTDLEGLFVGYTAATPDLYLTGYGWLFEPATGRWYPLESTPDASPTQIPRHGSVVVWAGPDLVIWGGFTYGDDGRGEMVDNGWMWRPES